MSFLFGDPNAASKREAARVRQQEEARQARIDGGMSGISDAFSSFDDTFFDGRRQSYVDFAAPQIEQQFGDARKQLIFALNRGGKLDSSTAADKFGRLDETYGKATQDIQSKGLDFANTARSSVEDARSSLVSQLFATEDADVAVSSALNRAKALSSNPSFSEVGNYFQNLTAGLASSLGGASTGFRGVVPSLQSGGASRERVVY